MNKEVRREFLRFAVSPQATRLVNVHDLRDAVTRMAILTPRGRMPNREVKEEQDQLLARWQTDTVGKQDNLTDS